MATLADELQADFLDLESEEENEEEEQEQEQEHGANGVNGDADDGDDAMGEDGVADHDAAGGSQQDKVSRALDEAEDEQEAKERIEKINLRNVSDFKSVANLWKSLKPVLEVCCPTTMI